MGDLFLTGQDWLLQGLFLGTTIELTTCFHQSCILRIYKTFQQNFICLLFESFYEVKYTQKANITVHIEKIEMKIRNNKENFVEKFGEINMVKTRGELIVYFQKKTFPANGLDSASHGQLE